VKFEAHPNDPIGLIIPSHLMKHVLCSIGSWIDENSAVRQVK